ncbi:MAG: hypothetical protein M1834_005729 [Cirrosporium novae-zelandiae]|nr:MAG: hypothetical protein M1834_005729 [Cirrosporium novae-zelandiae]
MSSSLVTTRALLRHQQFTTRRLLFSQSRTSFARSASTSSEAAQKAKESAASAAAKAQETFSKVTAAAGPALTNAIKGMSNATLGIGKALGNVGGRSGRLIAFVQSMIPPTMYYSKVFLELAKLVVEARKMTPPPAESFNTYYKMIMENIRQPRSLLTRVTKSPLTPESALQQLRNVDRQQAANAAVIFAEVMGFFTVGTMIGRMKIVGYRGGNTHHEEH